MLVVDGIEPPDSHKVLGRLWIVAACAEAFAVTDHVYRESFTVRRWHGELVSRLHGLQDTSHADIPGLRNVHPHTVARGQQLECLAVPAAAAATDVSIVARVLPGPVAAVGHV